MISAKLDERFFRILILEAILAIATVTVFCQRLVYQLTTPYCHDYACGHGGVTRLVF
jgi:hypothetical protein